MKITIEKAVQELEVNVGSDGIVQINIDGVCAMRVRLGKDCLCKLRGGIWNSQGLSTKEVRE